ARARGLPGRRLVEPGGSDGAIQHDRYESTKQKMTQLIENKPPRRALIVTLFHSDAPTTVVVLPNRGLPGRRRVEPGGPVQRESKDRPRLSHRCFVGRSFSSAITGDARSAYRCAPLFAEGLAAFRRAACIRSFDRSSKSRNSNRNIRRLETHLTLGR